MVVAEILLAWGANMIMMGNRALATVAVVVMPISLLLGWLSCRGCQELII